MKLPSAVLLSLLPLVSSVAAPSTETVRPDHTSSAEAEAVQDPTMILAGQVDEIASSSALSRKIKEKRIAKAVRTAVLAATHNIKDPSQIMASALEFAAVATKVAPDFATLIATSIGSLPTIAAIEGSSGQLTAVVEAAAQSATTPNVAVAAPSQPRPATPAFGGPVGSDIVVVSGARP